MYMIAIAVMSADLAIKSAIKANIPQGQKKKVFKRLYLWHVKNNGLAYGRLKKSQPAVFAASAGVIGIVFAYLMSLKKAPFSQRIGASLILGGGLGNLVDRIMNKEVTDYIYIDFKKAPIFNLADMAAVLGGIITVADVFRS